MELMHVGAGEQKHRIIRAADVEIGSTSAVHAVKVAGRKSWRCAFTRMQHALNAEGHTAGIVAGYSRRPAVRERLCRYEELNPAYRRKLHHLVDVRLGRKPR